VRPRCERSISSAAKATMASKPASSLAACKSIMPCQMRTTPSASVGKLKKRTVAKSASASIRASATPAAMAGREIGSTTFQ